jgi:transcriptional regulator with XRE-family HTH domain
MILGERLRQARQRAQLSQQRLGELIGQDQQYISKLERDVLPGMTVETLEQLCNALKVSADYLLGREDTNPV